MKTVPPGRRSEEVDANRPVDLDAFTRAVMSPSIPPEETWQPVIIEIAPRESKRLRAFCRAHRVALFDAIDRQLLDLAAVRLPSSDAAARQRFIDDAIAARRGRDAYGNWVYLPWEAKIVHLLDAEAYFDVITSRNHDKITRDEQRLLRTKRVGVMGLSVGGEAAVTIAQEHLCGEIVVADFDRLDLSNLNRLNAGFDELGRNKAILVARRIARIDPYLRVTVLDQGITRTNLEQFLSGLDLLVEECDDLAIKHAVRRHARERNLNVVFAADERGFLSIEPYADRPELAPFHGRIGIAQPPRESFPSGLAFMRALAEWMGGWDTISERSQRSVEQIGERLCGYPQLAAEARYAAGQIGHVARRLLLGERVAPFIGYLDLTDLLAPMSRPSQDGRPA